MKRKTILIFWGIYLLTLIFRLYSLSSSSIHMDEVIWMVNGKEFFYALLHHNFQYFQHAWWNNPNETYAIGIPAVLSSGISQFFLAGAGKFSLHLFSDIVASRLPIAIIASFLPPMMFLFLARLGNPIVGLVAALTYALNPASLNLDRWLLHDSFLNLFSFLAIVAFINATEKKKNSILPGIWMAVAFLSKPHGLLVLIPWALIYLSKKTKTTFTLLWSNLISFLISIVILWPESWTHPIYSIYLYMFRQLSFAQTGFVYFFMGKVTADQGPFYYLFEILVKTPELILIGLIVSLCLIVRSSKNIPSKLRAYVWPVSAYLISFLILISLSIAKPGIRYALPLFPWIYIFSGFGLVWLYNRLTPVWAKAILIIISLISIINPLSYFPEYQMYYNSFLGGATGAQKFDRVSVCVGHKKALEYLDTHNISGTVYIYGCQDSALYESPRSFTRDYKQADLFIVEGYLEQTYPDDIKLQYITQNSNLIFAVNQYGVTTAKVYQRIKSTSDKQR